eukprot:scaffold34748_cov68-Phaeocystis_antarctica.AAC.7
MVSPPPPEPSPKGAHAGLAPPSVGSLPPLLCRPWPQRQHVGRPYTPGSMSSMASELDIAASLWVSGLSPEQSGRGELQV